METIDFDRLVQSIDQMGYTKKSESPKRNFGTYENVFLSGILGQYEFRILPDINGSLTSSVSIHTITLADGSRKITTLCKGPDKCEICKSVDKLESLGFQGAWRFRKYFINKIFIKTGDVSDLEHKGDLNPDTVYIAYVNNKFINAVKDALKTANKYEPDSLKKLCNVSETSGGIIMKSSKDGRSFAYSATFQPSLKIEGINVESSFGSEENFDLNVAGYQSYVKLNEDKYNTALSSLNGRILQIEMEKNKGSRESVTDMNLDIDEKLRNLPDETPSESVNEEVEVAEPKVEEPKVESVESKVENSSDGELTCFGNFESNDSKCISCPKKRDCVMKMMGV